jgi:flagellar hook-basal body complex protein FliE
VAKKKAATTRATKAAPAKKTTTKKSEPVRKATALTATESGILKQLHPDLQPKALEMRQDAISEISTQVGTRWKWGKYIDECSGEKKYGEGQVALLSEFLNMPARRLYELRKFYQTYPTKKALATVESIRRPDSKPLTWSVILEVLIADLEDDERLSFLEEAAVELMTGPQLRKHINDSLRKSNPSRKAAGQPTAEKVLKDANKEAEKNSERDEDFTDTLENRLLKGNSEDFTDEIMQELESTKVAIQEMVERLQTQLEVVNQCIARGEELRAESAELDDYEEDEEDEEEELVDESGDEEEEDDGYEYEYEDAEEEEEDDEEDVEYDSEEEVVAEDETEQEEEEPEPEPVAKERPKATAARRKKIQKARSRRGSSSPA